MLDKRFGGTVSVTERREVWLRNRRVYALSQVHINKLFCDFHFLIERLGGLMVSVLDSRSSGPGSAPGQGHCDVFLGKTLSLLPLCLSPPRYINGYWRI